MKNTLHRLLITTKQLSGQKTRALKWNLLSYLVLESIINNLEWWESKCNKWCQRPKEHTEHKYYILIISQQIEDVGQWILVSNRCFQWLVWRTYISFNCMRSSDSSMNREKTTGFTRLMPQKKLKNNIKKHVWRKSTTVKYLFPANHKT